MVRVQSFGPSPFQNLFQNHLKFRFETLLKIPNLTPNLKLQTEPIKFSNCKKALTIKIAFHPWMIIATESLKFNYLQLKPPSPPLPSPHFFRKSRIFFFLFLIVNTGEGEEPPKGNTRLYHCECNRRQALEWNNKKCVIAERQQFYYFVAP